MGEGEGHPSCLGRERTGAVFASCLTRDILQHLD